MASLVPPCRSQLPHPRCLLLIITFTIFVGSAVADPAPPPETICKPVEVYTSCKKTLLPKRCSVRLSILSKSLAEAKEVLTAPQEDIAAGLTEKFKSDPCVQECTKVVDAAASKAAAAVAGGEDALMRLKGYLYPLLIDNDKPVGPCACRCPGEQCASADEAMAVKKMGEASKNMQVMANLFQTFSNEEC
ncbi:hypothetical protein C2845_PM05G18490 [Panicum miliaceum]|uniref:Pectinesterase inhibitor domain-containing protein n=1 Tax=Panicum miliaceum TaxID=4540 RepID=A0A3L6SW43_PANMI|nr:hypothetical protein C2845_PM05G18490 [Panicum miliaceum]